ncbi:MAG: hypothetical protein L0Y71_22455 [Gemmataceae bacterium]|nr:hypothetical protein [Gemmataceae bacterium]
MRTILTILCLLCAGSTAHAQLFISGGDFERQLRPGYNVPNDGQPFSHRYGYTTEMSSFYLGHQGWRLGYLEYLDRIDRAEKFGYCPPPYDCRYEFPAAAPVVEQAAPAVTPAATPAATVSEPPPASNVRVGIGFGFFRRR